MERKKVAPGTRAANYRCSLPGLAGFVGIASPRAKTGLPQIQSRKRCSTNPAAANFIGGERGIRTLGTLRYTRFPIVLLRPLGHLSNKTFLLRLRFCVCGGRGWSVGFGLRAQFRRSCFSCSRSEREKRLRGLFEHGAQTRSDSGEGGIRTPGTLAGTPDFESGAIDRTLPPLQVVANAKYGV